MTEYILPILLSIPGAVLAFTIKGWAKAFTADRLGDPTPRNMGRLTMNPAAHIDIIGFLFIVIFGFGWTKPVMANTRNFKNIKRDNAIFILSGPVACILAAFIASFFTIFTIKIGIWFPSINAQILSYLVKIFAYAQTLCISLAAFYLLPLPGLDGYELIANFLPYQWYRKLYNIEKYSMYIFIGFILLMRVTNLGNYIFWPANMLNGLFTLLWSIVLGI